MDKSLNYHTFTQSNPFHEKWRKPDSRTTIFNGWCTGYYACSVAPSLMQKNIRYIESQTEHHRIAFFDSEIKTMYRNMGLTFHPDDLR